MGTHRENADAQAAGAAAGAVREPDWERVRGDFPVLHRLVRGRPLVYFDNAATTQKPAIVIRTECEYYGTCTANVHRAIHFMAEEATRRYEAVRAAAARFVDAPGAASTVVTRGTTEAINLVARGWAIPRLKPGDRILVTGMEHHSNLVPWQMAARATGAELRSIPVDDAGELDLRRLPELLGNRTRLLALTHVSNVLGTVNPVRQLADAAHAAGAAVLVDAAQSVAHMPVSMAALGADFLAFSGHKMCGPTGVGFLCARPERLEEMEPVFGGGEMIARVEETESTWAEIPHRFEAGTPNIAGVIGMGAAFEVFSELGMDAVQRRDAMLTRVALEQLAAVPGLRIVGAAPDRIGVVAFALEDAHPHDVAQLLDRDGIAIRAGHMCAQPLLRRFGHAALNRASLAFYNRPEEFDVLAESLVRARRALAGGRE